MSFYLVKVHSRDKACELLGYGHGNNAYESVVEWLSDYGAGYPLYPKTDDPYLKLFFVVDRTEMGAAQQGSLSELPAIEYFLEIDG